ncbi:MAG: hypothetical protein HYW16_01335 [Candidatus Rokubacteria bacterium]|nr:hypothetical protein [Candidatus Rokubacteria bacterium]
MADSGVLERLVAQVGWQIRRRRAEFYGLRGLFFGALLGLVPLLLKTAVGSAAPLSGGAAFRSRPSMPPVSRIGPWRFKIGWRRRSNGRAAPIEARWLISWWRT